MTNRFIFPVGGTPESVRTQIGAVGPAPEPGSVPAPVVGEVLTWDGTQWVPGAGGGGGGITQLTGDVTTLAGSGPQAATVARLQGYGVSSVAPSDGQVLTWNGSAWVPGAPASGGSGGGGQIYFLNAGTAGAAPVTNIPGSPLELDLTAEAGQTTVISGALPSVGFSLIAGFVTKVNSPNLGAVPAGLWDFNVWASASTLTPNGTSFRIKVYVYDGTLPVPTLTLLATSATTQIYDPSQTVQYVSSVVLPQTATATTDRIYVALEGNSTSGTDTITASFGGSTPSHGHTTLPSVSGSGIVHVVNGVVQSPAGPVDLTAGATEISGTLPIGNGGTGLATTPTDGQLLIGNTASSDYTLATLTQGSNVTITNGAGSITIDAVGSIAGTVAANEIAFGTGVDSIGGSAQLEWNAGTGVLTVADAAITPVLTVDTANAIVDLAVDELRLAGDAGTAGEVLTSNGPGVAPTWQAGGGGGAVYAGALTVYVDPVNGSDITGTGTLGAPYASINYAYSQVPSLGDVLNVAYNANVGQYITEKLILQLAPGRYVENVVLGFKRARVQLVGGGVQIVGSVTLSAVRADFPAANMQSIRASFPTPWTGAGALVTFEITGGGLAGLSGIESSGGVESDATSDTLLVTGLTTLLFDEPTVPGGGVFFPNWDGNYGQFNFYANRANLIGGQVIATSYTVPTTNGLPTCVIEVEGCTIGESSNFVRSYLGAVPYAYYLASTPTTNWAKGTGVATGAGQLTTALVDTTKSWTPGEYIGATLRLTSGTGSGQTATVTGNSANTLTFLALATAPVANSTVYSLVGVTNKAPTGTITIKAHNSTLGASIGPRLTLGELDGCRVYDIDRTMLGTVDNGAVTGSTSTSYIGLVINQFRQFSGTGIPASQYQLGASTGTTRYKLDSTSYTTLAFNRSGAGVLTARTLNFGGGVSFDFQDDSRSLAFTPTTSAQWAAPAPTTVQSALDRIASAVFVLRGNVAIP